ncbi:hypothetical protein SeLEV6574_g07895 [Synchytrium endobioticum]|uniref:JmjC domain-containing protein n=1 Tax=Synchytrium endobioticum TaxID=286115 RepID=A0A507C726_9FUNG|nr:hypothetical protein SeLEV6574_g07895 [Synchytrium endobioticum]
MSTHNSYRGFQPSPAWRPSRISPTQYSPAGFYATFIQPRQPVILTQLLPDPSFKLDTFTPEYIKASLRDVLVQVERAGKDGNFGTSHRRIRMNMGEFLTRAEDGDEFYLSTQYDDDDEDSFMFDKSPIRDILPLFPLRPSLFSTLVPQQANIWMGASQSGSSSGLHHDYADNLYILLSGSKRFTIYPPHHAPYLYLHSPISRIHANGLISYSDNIRSDGAFISDVAKWKVEILEGKLMEMQNSGDEERVQQVEEEIEKAMDAMLEGEMGRDDDLDAFDDYEDEDLDEEDADTRNSTKERNADPPACSNKRKADSHTSQKSPKHAKLVTAAAVQPPSFSRIPLSMLRDPSPKVFKQFPLLKNATPFVIDLDAGEMLYLPASWMHEVTSFSKPSTASDVGTKHIHMAFNYWFHPPSESGTFAFPYEDDYWACKWSTFEKRFSDVMSRGGPDCRDFASIEMFKPIILLVVLALCHQAISMYCPEASGSPEESSVEASGEHATWNTRPGFREPEMLMESVMQRDSAGRYRNRKDRKEKLAIIAEIRSRCNKKIGFLRRIEAAVTKQESEFREKRYTCEITRAFALAKNALPGGYHVQAAEELRDEMETKYSYGDPALNGQIQSTIRAIWKLILRVMINNYKFYDLTPGRQLFAVERRALLMLVDTIKAKMEAGPTENLDLDGCVLDDDGMGFRGREQSELDDLYFQLEEFHEVLEKEHRKLDVLEAARAVGNFMPAEYIVPTLKTNDEINEVFKGLDVPEEFYLLWEIQSFPRLLVAAYLHEVCVDNDFLGIEAETERHPWNTWAFDYVGLAFCLRSNFLKHIRICLPDLQLNILPVDVCIKLQVESAQVEMQLVHMPELDKYSIRSGLDTNSMNGPQYHQTAEHAESSSSAQASFYGDDTHILPFLQQGLGQMDINSHSTESFGSNIRDVPSNQRDMGVTYTRASDDSWPRHTFPLWKVYGFREE